MTGLCLGWEDRRQSPVYSIHALFPFLYYLSFDIFHLGVWMKTLLKSTQVCFLHLNLKRWTGAWTGVGKVRLWVSVISPDDHVDLVFRWLSPYWSEPCSALLCFTQPHFTSYHSAHIRLGAWYAPLGSDTLPESELIKCQLTWAQRRRRPHSV